MYVVAQVELFRMACASSCMRNQTHDDSIHWGIVSDDKYVSFQSLKPQGCSFAGSMV